MSEAQLISESQ